MPRRTLSLLASSALLLGLIAGTARADMIQLKDGRWVEGVKMRVDGECVVVQYKNGDVRVPMKLIEDWVIDGQVPIDPGTADAKGKRAEGLVPWKGKWVKPEVRDKGLKDEMAKRLAQIEDAKAHSEWRNRHKWETKNFKFESTLPRSVGDEYAALLESYFEIFKKDWGIKVPKEWGKLPICFYRSRKEFLQTGGAGGGAIAYYRFVAPRELNFYYDRGDVQMTQDALFHEANHYLADLIDEKTNYPHWIGEAMAEYYGGADWDGKARTLKCGRVQEGRLADVRADMDGNKKVRLRELVGCDQKLYEHYTWGWSFFHFMMSTPAYQAKWKKYVLDLATSNAVKRQDAGFNFVEPSGDECLRHFCKLFGTENLDAMEKEWYAHIEKMDPTTVRGLEQGGLDAWRQGRIKFKAPRMLKGAIEKGSVRPMVHILYSRCIRFKHDASSNQEALDAIDHALKVCDPLESDLWAERGMILYSMGQQDEGKKHIELAREMNPEEPYVELDVMEALKPEGE
jgi:hypothetical protein